MQLFIRTEKGDELVMSLREMNLDVSSNDVILHGYMDNGNMDSILSIAIKNMRELESLDIQ